MFSKAHLLLLLLIKVAALLSNADNGFTFTGNLKIEGVEEVTPDNRVIITNKTTSWGVGHAFYSHPLRFKNSSNGNAFSFSSAFVFGMVPENPLYAFHGMAFVIAPSKDIAAASSSQHLGLFNRTNDGQPSNHIVAIELDTFQSLDVGDINGNHVGLDVNSIVSVISTPFSSSLSRISCISCTFPCQWHCLLKSWTLRKENQSKVLSLC